MPSAQDSPAARGASGRGRATLGLTNDDETAWGMNPTSKDSDGDDIDDCTEACPENDGSCFDGSVCTVKTPANTDNDDTIDALDSDSDDDAPGR